MAKTETSMKQKSLYDLTAQSVRIVKVYWKQQETNKYNWRLKRKIEARIERLNLIYGKYRSNVYGYFNIPPETSISDEQAKVSLPRSIYAGY